MPDHLMRTTYRSGATDIVLDIRRIFPHLYLLVNQANWEDAFFCMDDLQACVEQYAASCPRYPSESIREKIVSIRVSIAMPTVDYFKRKSVNLKLNDLVLSLIRIGVPLR